MGKKKPNSKVKDLNLRHNSLVPPTTIKMPTPPPKSIEHSSDKSNKT